MEIASGPSWQPKPAPKAAKTSHGSSPRCPKGPSASISTRPTSWSTREAVDVLGPSILHVHATDAFCELATGRRTQVSLGEGTADYPALLGALDQHDYRGYFTVAHRTAEDPTDVVAGAIGYLRSI